MSDDIEILNASAVKNQEQAAQLMEKLLAVAEPGKVFAAPVQAGDYTIITASEVTASLGFGYGYGGGTGPAPSGDEGEGEVEEKKGSAAGVGGGGGGGGASVGRPVAVVVVGPDGVEVEPVVDATKISIALFTTLGAMAIMLGRMARQARRLSGR